MINCEQAAKLFQSYLDRELSPQDVAKVEEHIKVCKDCFGHLEFDRSLRRLLKNQSLADKLSPEVKDLIQKKLKN